MSKQKVILVTGSSSRLGQSIVKHLKAEKYIVYRGQRVDGDVNIDVTKDESCKHAIEKILKKSERLDVVINVAGVTTSGTVIESETKQFLELLDVNVVGQLRLNALAASYMSKRGIGQIINITSLSGRVPLPGFGIYSASKSAAESLGEALHYEMAQMGVRVTNVAPGAIAFDSEVKATIAHRPVREKIPLLKYLLPMATPDVISSRIVKLIKNPGNPVRLTIGFDARVIIFLYRFLPIAVFEKIVQYLWQRN